MLSQEEFDRLQAASGGAAESDKAVREYKDFKDWLFNAPVDLSKLDLTRNERDFAGTGAAIVNPWGEE